MKALVTGGGGFLGRALVEALLADGHEVISIARSPHPEIEALGARSLCIDLGQRDELRDSLKGVDTVFHAAAKVGAWGSRADYERVNVVGTRNLLAACERQQVQRLVFTSSPSVVFDGTDQKRASNDLPYAERFLAHYPRTKAIAERDVLGAHGRWGLATCALRPHLIIGPRDPHLLPRLIERARAGRLAIVGDGRNEVTLCAVENAAHAHVLAAKSLAMHSPHAGKAYFIGQAEPVLLWEWINALLSKLSIPPITRHVPRALAYAAGAACEAAWMLFRRAGEPPMTRFVAAQLGGSHSFDMGPAERDFGYREIISLDAATEAIVAELARR
jgi:nucleoside-diphosphate-sugar epimerase